MTRPHVVILGAGPAGLGAAFRLRRDDRAAVTVLERNARLGGNAGSFDLAGCRVDYGSHRLHPACDAAILSDIRTLLGEDLLERPRHGRIRLRGRWIHFPLKPLDLALRLPPSFLAGVAADGVRKAARRNGAAAAGRDSFASVLEAGLGRTICRDFYFPYARKIWGLAPEELAAAQARRRVSAGSISKMLAKVWAAVPGVGGPRGGRFFYPRRGYGQISEAYGRAAEEAGADMVLEARVVAVETRGNTVAGVRYERVGQIVGRPADHVWSTLPITALARCLDPPPPSGYLRAAESLDYRAMILVYLVLEQGHFSDYDAHYFPELDTPITRISEPKNYSGGHGPADRTVLCAELPCAPDDRFWQLDDGGLGELVQEALERAGLPIRAPVKEVRTRRLRHAYPIYRRDYDTHLDRLDELLGGIEGLVTFGRQGLFAHDNTHHALYMAYSAVDCLRDDGSFDRERWTGFRRVFETHVVED
jgi:protoporphyrinogen oxidase